VSVDAKAISSSRYEVHVAGGRRSIGVDPAAAAIRMEELGAGEVFLNSVDRDGTRCGYDLELLRQVAGSVSIPVVICGGAGTLADLAEAERCGASGLAAGSLFVFHGKYRAVLLSYPSTKELSRTIRRFPDAI